MVVVVGVMMVVAVTVVGSGGWWSWSWGGRAVVGLEGREIVVTGWPVVVPGAARSGVLVGGSTVDVDELVDVGEPDDRVERSSSAVVDVHRLLPPGSRAP